MVCFPNEIINHIFSYCQSRTNKIMKRHIKCVRDYETGMIGLLRINKDYGFKQFNERKLNKAYWIECAVCKAVLWPEEYRKNINYDGIRMCSRRCKLDYEMMYFRTE